jgi:hypothetical protein
MEYWSDGVLECCYKVAGLFIYQEIAGIIRSTAFPELLEDWISADELKI